jgi:hypothetical protein
LGLEPVLRRRLLLSQSSEAMPRRELEIDSEIVKLIALTTKNAMPQRSLELFQQLRSNQTRLVAMKWVGSNGYDQLFSKMEGQYRVVNRNLDETNPIEEAEEVEREEDSDEHKKKSTKRASFSDDVVDDSNHKSVAKNSAPTKVQKTANTKSNPFSAKSSMRRSSSGGVFEQLARIEVNSRK